MRAGRTLVCRQFSIPRVDRLEGAQKRYSPLSRLLRGAQGDLRKEEKWDKIRAKRQRSLLSILCFFFLILRLFLPRQFFFFFGFSFSTFFLFFKCVTKPLDVSPRFIGQQVFDRAQLYYIAIRDNCSSGKINKSDENVLAYIKITDLM